VPNKPRIFSIEYGHGYHKNPLSMQISLLEKPSVTQDHNTRVTENYVTNIDREAQSLGLTDFSDRSSWMMEFSVTLVFWSCA
jgi:hypothetical protein